jgi:hypothetical protein
LSGPAFGVFVTDGNPQPTLSPEQEIPLEALLKLGEGAFTDGTLLKSVLMGIRCLSCKAKKKPSLQIVCYKCTSKENVPRPSTAAAPKPPALKTEHLVATKSFRQSITPRQFSKVQSTPAAGKKGSLNVSSCLNSSINTSFN